MLKNHVEQERPGEEELGRRLEEARKRLGALQMQIKEHGLPVLVLMEGWGTAGKGSTIGKIIRNIDPRFFKVANHGGAYGGGTEETVFVPVFCQDSRGGKIHVP